MPVSPLRFALRLFAAVGVLAALSGCTGTGCKTHTGDGICVDKTENRSG